MTSDAITNGFRDWIRVIMMYRSDHPDSVRILDTIERVLDRGYRTHALIRGEAGTGKEALARALHHAMRPVDAPFLKLQTAGRSEGVLLEQIFGHKGALAVADGGTVFLDEVADLPLEVQARLTSALRGKYRRLEDYVERTCDVTIVGASDFDLSERVGSGSFRSDLYFRLSRIALRIPPLRERSQDVLSAALWSGNRILQMHGSDQRLAFAQDAAEVENAIGLDEAAVQLLCEQPWDGNFRALDRVMERALMLYRDENTISETSIQSALHD